MSAETLREAARVLRERAGAATRGPWFTDEAGTNGVFTEARVSGTSEDVAYAAAGWGRVGTDHYIATMHPGVGLALADLLEHLATDHENADVDGRTWDHGAVPLARAILGGAS